MIAVENDTEKIENCFLVEMFRECCSDSCVNDKQRSTKTTTLPTKRPKEAEEEDEKEVFQVKPKLVFLSRISCSSFFGLCVCFSAIDVTKERKMRTICLTESMSSRPKAVHLHEFREMST